jgi:hypothetical protein
VTVRVRCPHGTWQLRQSDCDDEIVMVQEHSGSEVCDCGIGMHTSLGQCDCVSGSVLVPWSPARHYVHVVTRLG